MSEQLTRRTRSAVVTGASGGITVGWRGRPCRQVFGLSFQYPRLQVLVPQSSMQTTARTATTK